MRRMLAAMVLFGFALPVHAGSDPGTTPRAGRSESAPKPDLERPAASPKPVDGKALCTYVSPDQNAPSERGDCVADRDPMPQQPVEKSPPGPLGGGATPSSR